MLILGRNKGQEVMIGEDVIVTVIDIRGNQVKLGFDAPLDVTIHRKEIFLRLKEEKENEKTSN